MDELREKIAQYLYEHSYPRMYHTFDDLKNNYPGGVEAIMSHADQIHTLYKEAGYVRLSQDQSLPNKPPYLTLAQGGYKQALVDICEAGWRKVEL